MWWVMSILSHFAGLVFVLNKKKKQLFIRFLSLYLLSSFGFLGVIFTLYYQNEITHLESIQTYQMRTLAMDTNARLIQAHMGGDRFILPLAGEYRLALYDENLEERYTHTGITGLNFKNTLYNKQNRRYYIDAGALLHKGVKYVVVEGVSLDILHHKVWQKALFWFMLFALFLMFVGYFLSRMFLQPITESMAQMEKFIKDTTHELNTPVTALMMSVGKLLKTKVYDEKALKRISISSKNIHETYRSLTHISFDTMDERRDEVFDMCEVVEKSTSYFSELIESKALLLDKECARCVVLMDKEMAQRMVNNLLSNAIKYTHREKKIHIIVKGTMLVIEDEGIGIAGNKITNIYDRYTRVTDFTGGFGVGLSIVKDVCDMYGIGIDVKSEINKGSQFILDFSKVLYNGIR